MKIKTYIFPLNSGKVDILLHRLIDNGIEYEISSQCGSDIVIKTKGE